MKPISLLLISAFSTLLIAAEPGNPEPRSEADRFCHRPDGRYSPGAIIRQDDTLYRCVAAYDADLQRNFVWVRVTDATQTGAEISIYWQ